MSERGGKGSPPSGPKSVPRPKEMRKKELRADFLLNFSQRPSSNQRPQQYAPPPRRARPGGGGGGGGGGSVFVPRSNPASFARGRFVQSSFRILVDALTPDVVEATLNADAMLDWASVRRVDLQCEALLKCPICLEEDMVVPKITRCGHVFCVACLMRYFLALQEYNGRFWQKCPVCNNQQVSPEELISVRFELQRAPREGETLRFVLARRVASSTVVRPPPSGPDGAERKAKMDAADPWSLPLEGEAGWHLSRLARLPPGRFARMLAEELEGLAAFRTACLATGDTELLPSIDAASKLLEQSRRERGGDEAEDVFGELLLPAGAEEDDDAGRSDGEDAPVAAGSGARASSSSTTQSPALRSTDAVTPSPPGAARGCPSHLISFYQADDGRLVFLQPFFTRLLLHEHGGSWDGLPEELPEVRLERVQEASVTEETRKRHRFLAHLPVGSQISFAEIDLRSLISKETKEHFAEEFVKLREQRKKEQQKSRREDRLSKSRAEKEEAKYYSSLNRPHPSTVVLQQVPTDADFVPLPGSRPAAEAEEPGEAAEGAESGGEGPTMAERLRERLAARSRPGDPRRFPELRPAAPAPDVDDPSRFPQLSAGRGAGSSSGAKSSAWGRGSGAEKAAGKAAKEEEEAAEAPRRVKESWDDDSAEEAEEHPSFGRALDAALRSASGAAVGADAAEGDAPEQSGGAGGKKKKGRAGKSTTIRLFG